MRGTNPDLPAYRAIKQELLRHTLEFQPPMRKVELNRVDPPFTNFLALKTISFHARILNGSAIAQASGLYVHFHNQNTIRLPDAGKVSVGRSEFPGE